MAYVKPTTQQFKTRFPEFGPVRDALLSAIIDEVEPGVGVTWVENDRSPAIMYLVAHMLTIQGEPQRSLELAAGGSGANVLNGPMKRRKVGDVEVEYQNANERQGTGSGVNTVGNAGYELTMYGRQFKLYLRRNFAAVAVV